MEHFGAHADTFVERGCADGADHEFLEADGCIGVCAAVDDVHHGNGQYVGVAAADVFVEGQVEVVGGSFSYGQGYAEDGVGAKIALGVGAVEGEHCFIDGNLVEGAHAHKCGGDGAVDVGYSLEHAFAHVAVFVVVAELEGFVDAGGCAGGHAGTAESAGFQYYVYFYGGVATGVEDLTTDDFFDFHCLIWFYTLVYVLYVLRRQI